MTRALSTLANSAWQAQSLRAVRRFERALRDPAAAQARLLRAHLKRTKGTAWGRRVDIDRVQNPADFAARLPLQTYDDLAPWIERIMAGERSILTHDPVTKLIPTSGSTAAVKLIPYTAGLQRQFNAAIRPWVFDLFRQWPALRHGQAYWSISPAIPLGARVASRVPIGFDDDTEYLGWLGRKLANSVMAVPDQVKHQRDIDDFRFATVWWLLRARSLRLVSVWHPTFWSLLFDPLHEWWEPLMRGLRDGRCEREPGKLLMTASPLSEHDVRALEELGPSRPEFLWPKLTLISAWGDASSTGPLARLAREWPTVEHQPKGLISTEAFVSLPYQGEYPAAVTSHFIEWLADDGQIHPLEHAEIGGVYEPVVTTANGFCRYRTGDRVEITGRKHETPTLRFIGRGDRLSDLCGEKLSEAFVLRSIEAVLESHGLGMGFNLVTPTSHEAPAQYRWWVDIAGMNEENRECLTSSLDRALSLNPHYRWCRQLGQLGPWSVASLPPNAEDALLRRREAQTGLGNIKLGVLGTFEDDQTLRGLDSHPGTASVEEPPPKHRERMSDTEATQS